jgi:hypothetical protein
MNLGNLKFTPEERNTIDWCCSNLEPEQIADIEEEAREIASVEINAPEAAETLLSTWVQVLVRNAKDNGIEL